MNIIRNLNKINAIGKYLIVAFIIMNLIPAVSASTGLSNALMSLCGMAKTLLGIGVMLLIILAGTIYAIGQILGAETRARATVWATAMLTGAVIGIVIYIVTPVIVNALMSGNTNASIAVSC